MCTRGVLHSVAAVSLATLLIIVLTLSWRLLPAGGILPSVFEDPAGNLKRMVMPALALGLPSASVYFRMVRSSLLEVIRSDYMRTAYSKGLRERRVILVHGLKNALIPVVTLLGMFISQIMGGSVLIETVFNIPGMGRLLATSVFDKDYVMVQICILVIATIVSLANLAVDISYGYLDPRIRYE